MKPAARFKTKIRSPQALKKIVRTKRDVVFTNGCFDLLHKGHVTYLEEAKRQGKSLIVALNSDSSVKILKGPTRPINPLADRLEVIAALESVDYVTWFEDETPLELIRLLRPKILVKGGDWKANQIVGSADVLSWGGKVKSLKFVDGHSTTKLIEKSQKS